MVPVPDDQLPVVLPEDLVLTVREIPLAKTPSFYAVRAPVVASRRGGRRNHGYFLGFVLVSTLRYPVPDQKERMTDARVRLLAAGRPIYRWHRTCDFAPSLFPLLEQGDARS